MGPHVGCEDTKIICVWESDDRCCFVITVKLVAKLFLQILQLKKHWVEDHEKNGWTEGVALKDSPTEWEGLGAPGLGLHHGPAVVIQCNTV